MLIEATELSFCFESAVPLLRLWGRVSVLSDMFLACLKKGTPLDRLRNVVWFLAD